MGAGVTLSGAVAITIARHFPGINTPFGWFHRRHLLDIFTAKLLVTCGMCYTISNGKSDIQEAPERVSPPAEAEGQGCAAGAA